MAISCKCVNSALAFIVFALFLASLSFTSNAQTLYSCPPPYDHNPILYTINPSTGATLTSKEIILPGETVNGCNGMAKDPTTGVCRMILNITVPETTDPRVLVTIDPVTGIATLIGNTGDAFAAIAFDNSGTLYGVTGDGASVPETLYTLSKINGSATFVQTLGNGEDGEGLGFNPNNGLLYHTSGIASPPDPSNVFESINPNSGIVTNIPIIGNTDDYTEQLAMVYSSGNTFLLANRNPFFLHSITTSGVVSDIGPMDHRAKGLAFDCGFISKGAEVPTMSEWGLIITVLLLGFVSFIVLRRKAILQK